MVAAAPLPLHARLIRLAIPATCAALAFGLAAQGQEEAPDPAEVALGERLFLETRFAQFFASSGVGVNEPLPAGDPVVETTQTPGDPLPGPFAGQSINCRACHLVDEQLDASGGGMRSYADFARRSPIPARADGGDRTPRNSPPLVNASLPRPHGEIFHFDGEFPTLEALVTGTLTGRNYGWLPDEGPQATAHIARVIREDDGSGALAQDFGGAYRVVLAGRDASIPEELRLPRKFRIDVADASDRQITAGVSKLIAAYVRQLVFEQDGSGAFVGSPFDRFLELNSLPRRPHRGESAQEFTARLRRAVLRLHAPVFVEDGPFEFHEQSRSFGALELEGLRVFLREAPAGRPLRRQELAAGGIGNCASCHPAPNFTDFGFHNTGVSQIEYDAIHGAGEFAELSIPGLARRKRHPNQFLPATARHPDAREPFRAVPAAERPGFTDLGVWNVFANPDFPAAQSRLWRALCSQELERGGAKRSAGAQFEQLIERCNERALLDASVALFKTPGLRDLSHGAPYMHNGQLDTLADVLGLYRATSDLTRSGKLRNAAPELAGIALDDADVAALVAFLRALNEDYS